MGREIKRVPLDFDWPLKQCWEGYLNPWRSTTCGYCNGSGYNPETKQVSDDWYDFEGTGRKWCHNITQDEVEALISGGRLMDFTHQFERGKGWIKIEPQPTITAEMVNQWSRSGLGHDSINQWICVEARAKRFGVFGHCKMCHGHGELWANLYVRFRHWLWRPQEPPKGTGWQVWENVTEGSPISPVFPERGECVNWLVSQGYSQKAAEKFVRDGSYAPSLIVADGKFYEDIESFGIGE